MTRRFLGSGIAVAGAALLLLFAAFVAWAHHMYAVGFTIHGAITTAAIVILGSLLMVLGVRLALSERGGQ